MSGRRAGCACVGEGAARLWSLRVTVGCAGLVSESSTVQHGNVIVELVVLQCCHSSTWRLTHSHWAKGESQQARRHALLLASELTCCTEHDRVDGHVPSVACAFHAHELNSRRAAGQVDLRRGVASACQASQKVTSGAAAHSPNSRSGCHAAIRRASTYDARRASLQRIPATCLRVYELSSCRRARARI